MENKYEKWIHMFLWFLLIASLFSSFGQAMRVVETSEGIKYFIVFEYSILLIIVIDVLSKALMFYLNTFLLTSYFKLKDFNLLQKRISLVSIFIITQALSILAWKLLSVLIISTLALELHSDYMMPYSIMFHFLLFLISIAFSFYVDRKRHIKLEKELSNKQLETELKLLKAQINPHFLFNTLNNIYSMVMQNEDFKTASTVAQLSRIMRYMIYESNAEKVPLSREIDHIKDFIALQKIRLPNPDSVVFIEKNSTANDFKIAPMLLIPFIENAFKHGVNVENQRIEVLAECREGKLFFKVCNSILPQAEQDSYKGFGLENVKKRLNIIYGGKHSLQIRKDEKFHVELEIDLARE